MSLAEASKFMCQQQTCVIATVDANGEPEAATIGFSHQNDWTIFVGTHKDTRKYANLMANPKCALVVGFEGPETVQVEGEARLATEDEVANRLPIHLAKVEAAKRFVDDPGQRWLIITPSWLRYTDFRLSDPVFETKDVA